MLLNCRSRSNPEELPSSPDEELMPPIRSHSMFIPPRDDALYGHSPPPGHHPDINLIHNHHDIHVSFYILQKICDGET